MGWMYVKHLYKVLNVALAVVFVGLALMPAHARGDDHPPPTSTDDGSGDDDTDYACFPIIRIQS